MLIIGDQKIDPPISTSTGLAINTDSPHNYPRRKASPRVSPENVTPAQSPALCGEVVLGATL